MSICTSIGGKEKGGGGGRTWNTKVSSKPEMARMPFMRYRSSPRMLISDPSHWLTCAEAPAAPSLHRKPWPRGRRES